MNRRTFLTATTVAPFLGVSGSIRGLAAPPASAMGIATTSYSNYLRPRDPLAFLDHCHARGAAGIQMQLPLDPEALRKIRARAEQYGMYLEGMVPLPKSNDQAPYEAALRAAKEAGAVAVRTASSGGRRYEKWNTLNDWKTFAEEATASIRKLPAIADRVKIPIAMENHKEWTIDEQLMLMKSYGGEYFGSLIDFGNNIALLDSPDAVLALAPWAKSVHVKDMAVQPWATGFLLSEVPLGEGILNLPVMVDAVRRANPKAKFSLEMMTREPLEVPCLTEKYWVTFPERNGQFLARTLATVGKESRRLQPLPHPDKLPKDAQLGIEDENVKTCLHYGRVKLGL